jgi:hypothetical protein
MRWFNSGMARLCAGRAMADIAYRSGIGREAARNILRKGKLTCTEYTIDSVAHELKVTRDCFVKIILEGNDDAKKC